MEHFKEVKSIVSEKDQAEIILRNLEKYIQIDCNFEEYYLKGIVNGLKEIKKSDSGKVGR